MKIKTITCHDVNNYGASLQAFALQTYLTNLGHDVKIIDYVPEYMKTYNVWKIPESSHLYKISKHLHFITVLFALKNYLKYRPTMGRIKAFQNFKLKYLHLTIRYKSFNELAANPPKADIYIAGSDQIWSTYLKNGQDAAFYCAFGDLNTRRISYAASFGFSEIKGGFNYFIKAMLTGFDVISTRESTGVKIIESLNLKACHVLDPVFLLNKQEWIRLFDIKSPIIKDKYLLVYDLFHTEQELKELSCFFAQKYGLKIVAVNDCSVTKYANQNINNAGPVEFLNLILYSEYILADSFHATAFSVIFRKQFYTFYSKGNISRMKDFLNSINLGERLNTSRELPDIEWEKHEEILSRNIQYSKSFLKENIL